MTVTVRVSDTREVLAAIAYNLGFHPTESIVVVSLRGPRHALGLTARIDLIDADQAAATLAGHLVQDGADAAVIVAYTQDGDQAHDATLFVDDALNAAGIGPVGVWWVTATDSLPINPQRPGESAHTGRALDLEATVIAATMVTHGRFVRSSRGAIAITPAPIQAQAIAAQAAATWQTEPTPTGRATSLRLWRDALHSEPSPQIAGLLAAALRDILVRDAILCDVIGDHDVATHVAAGTQSGAVGPTLGKVIDPIAGTAPDKDTTQPAADLLAHVAAHTPSAAALTLLAILAWWAGDGTRANVYLEATHQIDPDYRLAALVSHALAAGMAPGWIRRNQA